VDTDEWWDKLAGIAIIYLGSNGSEARFLFYFPPMEQGRFFQHITPEAPTETLAQQETSEEDYFGFSVELGDPVQPGHGRGVQSGGGGHSQCNAAKSDFGVHVTL
jgi:hypothetical protein